MEYLLSVVTKGLGVLSGKPMEIYRTAISGVELSADYEPSMEGTFETLSKEKLEAMVHSGIRRLSLGLQSTAPQILCHHHRLANESSAMKRWMKDALSIGVSKVNIDLMYGLKGQSRQTIDADLKMISVLRPQQLNLYELRTNMIANKDIPEKAVLYDQYNWYYNGLLSLGYKVRYGENTFSMDEKDNGLSSYLRSRMLEVVSYKGFGISARSMNRSGVSYNRGKGRGNIRNILNHPTYEGGVRMYCPKKNLRQSISQSVRTTGLFP